DADRRVADPPAHRDERRPVRARSGAGARPSARGRGTRGDPAPARRDLLGAAAGPAAASRRCGAARRAARARNPARDRDVGPPAGDRPLARGARRPRRHRRRRAGRCAASEAGAGPVRDVRGTAGRRPARLVRRRRRRVGSARRAPRGHAQRRASERRLRRGRADPRRCIPGLSRRRRASDLARRAGSAPVGGEAQELAAALVAIESTNPDLVANGSGEGPVASFVADWCRAAGLDVEVSDAAPGRPNVVAVARGRGGGPSLLLNAHTDTVGLGGSRGALDAVVEDGRLYGRGSYDMKGALAAAMLAASRARNLRGDVIVTAVADEEVASVGTEAVVRGIEADAAIVCEPTEEQVCIAHKGFVAFELETRGVAAHGSRPDLGIDAIARMGRVLVGIEELDARLRAAPSHPLLASGSVHASLIEGGQEYSSYPERCLLSGERRTVPGETVEQVEAELRALLGSLDGS